MRLPRFRNCLPPPAKKDAQQKEMPAAQNVARRKTRVALRATRLAAAVAQNGQFDITVRAITKNGDTRSSMSQKRVHSKTM